MKQNVFELLDLAKIVYAVGVSESTLRTSFVEKSRDYFVFIKVKDVLKLKRIMKKYKRHFTFRKITREDIYEYDLSSKEIAEFRNNLDKYNKVKHTENGRIYELKEKPFLLTKKRRKRSIAKSFHN